MNLWYLSFATDALGFIGATVVEAEDQAHALSVASHRGLNPGGEVAIWGPIPTDTPEAKMMLNRLVGEEELCAGGAKKIKDLDDDTADLAQSSATSICADCNVP